MAAALRQVRVEATRRSRRRAGWRRQQSHRAEELPQRAAARFLHLEGAATLRLLATGVDNLTIDNVLVDTDRDGFDIDCCKQRAGPPGTCCRTVNSPWDDAICPRSSFLMRLGYARSTDDVTDYELLRHGNLRARQRDCGDMEEIRGRLPRRRATSRIKWERSRMAASATSTISNCRQCEGSKGISLESSDGAYLEDIAISNITLRDTIDAPFFLRLNRHNRGPKETMRTGTLRRVMISNIVSHNSWLRRHRRLISGRSPKI